MKSLKDILSEVAEPKAAEEKRFKAQHTYEVSPHPVAEPHQHTGEIQKPKAKRIADQEGDANYDKAYLIRREAKEDDMPASPDEASMAMKQAEFLEYVGREVAEHVKGNKEFPEWMQNKLSAVHQAAKDLHATLGAHGGDDMDEEVELDEFHAKGMEPKASKKPSPSSTKKSLASIRKKMGESVELSEAVKAGNMKLNDGSSVKISKQDADLINQMMKDLNSKNRKEMQKVMMTDKAGFEEIVGFAREAL